MKSILREDARPVVYFLRSCFAGYLEEAAIAGSLRTSLYQSAIETRRNHWMIFYGRLTHNPQYVVLKMYVIPQSSFLSGDDLLRRLSQGSHGGLFVAHKEQDRYFTRETIT